MKHRHINQPDLGRTVAATGLVVVLAASSGCYRRVVSTSGLGNRGVNVEESYQEAWPIDPVVKELEAAGSSDRRQRGQSGRSGRPVFQGSTDR